MKGRGESRALSAEALQALVAEELEEVGDAAGVSPLVVIPRHDFDEAADADGVYGWIACPHTDAASKLIPSWVASS